MPSTGQAATMTASSVTISCNYALFPSVSTKFGTRPVLSQVCSNLGKSDVSKYRASHLKLSVETFQCPERNGRKRFSRVPCALSDDKPDDGLVEIPLFPLPLVLFPGTILPLQIFEYRYRILMHTLLQTDLRFGIVYAGKDNGTAAAIGCVGEIVKHERLPDDRFFLICRGQERFRVVDIVRSRPYLVGRVAWLEDKPSEQPQDLDALSDEVKDLMKDVIRLSIKMNGRDETESAQDLRTTAFPTPFSFWVASKFHGAPSEQQALLELEDTSDRLIRERDTLRNTLNYLSAAIAVKAVFPTSSEQ